MWITQNGKVWYSKEYIKQILKEIEQMLKISMDTSDGYTHFEYVENAYNKINEVLENE